jgi:large conductance mechanosensitive channel
VTAEARRATSPASHLQASFFKHVLRVANRYMILSLRQEAGMFKGFKQFILRGNVMDLAVAVVIGGAFGAVVTSFVNNIINKVIAAIVSKPDFSAFRLTVNGTDITYGTFINDLISFLLIAAAVYFFMVAPMNACKERSERSAARADPTNKKCPECLSDIPIAARRCAFCTSVVETARA